MEIIHDNSASTHSIYEIQKFSESTGEILSDDRHDWEDFKLKSIAVAGEFRTDDSSMVNRSERMFNCANQLVFTVEGDKRRLSQVWFCKDRMCPHCQQRRSLVIFHQVRNVCSAIATDYPTFKYILLTLTVPNVDGWQLADKISEMAKAWGRLVKRKEFMKGTKGWFRTLEVTYNPETGYHPHYHVLICVPSGYFKKSYIKQTRWLKLWQDAMRDPRILVVHVETVKPNPKREGSDAISSAAAEVGKYATKPGNYLVKFRHRKGYKGVAEPIQQLAESLQRRKLVAFGGLMLDYAKKLDLQDVESDKVDLIHTDGETDLVEAVTVEIFRWNIGMSAYIAV